MKIKIILFLFFLTLVLSSIEIPQPRNGELFREFNSYRYARYLKKPIHGTGYIAMDGKDRFVFVQTKPIMVQIKKINDRITYKKGFNMPIDVSNMAMDMFFLFEDQDVLKSNYDITKNFINNKDEYRIVPKEKNNLTIIKVTAIEDKVEIVELDFKDDAKIIYNFKNTVTGVKPDEKYF